MCFYGSISPYPLTTYAPEITAQHMCPGMRQWWGAGRAGHRSRGRKEKDSAHEPDLSHGHLSTARFLNTNFLKIEAQKNQIDTN